MGKIDYRVEILPDIEMYGGDTTPWYIQMMHGVGSSFYYSEADGFSCKLTITPFAIVTATHDPVLQKNGTIEEYGDEEAAAVFTFTEEDTKELFGKFIYQVEFSKNADKRIGQGNLIIKKNVG